MISIEDSIRGIKALNIPRIEDLPYASSPPVQFVYESTAALAAGSYTWADAPTALTVLRPVRENTLYYFRSISLVADVMEGDFTANLTTVPLFYMYLTASGRSLVFREPLRMNKFYDQFDFRQAIFTPSENDSLLASFRGVITQGAGLIGKASITLKAIISAQEVGDDAFTKLFRKPYPSNGA